MHSYKGDLVGIANGHFRQYLTELSARDTIMAGFYSLTFILRGWGKGR